MLEQGLAGARPFQRDGVTLRLDDGERFLGIAVRDETDVFEIGQFLLNGGLGF